MTNSIYFFNKHDLTEQQIEILNKKLNGKCTMTDDETKRKGINVAIFYSGGSKPINTIEDIWIYNDEIDYESPSYDRIMDDSQLTIYTNFDDIYSAIIRPRM